MAYRDVGKKATDVLRVGYCHDKPWQIAATRNGSPRFMTTGFVTANNIFDASPSIRYASNGLSIEGKGGTNGSGSCDLKYEFPKEPPAMYKFMGGLPWMHGLTVGTKYERKMVASVPTDSTEISAEMKTKLNHNKICFTPHNQKWNVSQCFTYDKCCGPQNHMLIGAEVNGGGKDLASMNYSVGACFNSNTPKPYAISLKGCGTRSPSDGHKFEKVVTSFWAATEQGHALAADVTRSTADSSTKVTLGFMAYLSPKKETSVKVKVEPNANVAAVMTHKFSDNLTGSFGVQFPGAGGEKPSSFGMKLAVSV